MNIIVQTKNKPLPVTSEKKGEFPLLFLRSEVLFPESVLVVPLLRQEEIKLARYCLSQGVPCVASYAPALPDERQHPTVHQVSTLARIVDLKEEGEEILQVTLEGQQRVALAQVNRNSSYPVVVVKNFKKTNGKNIDFTTTITTVLNLASEIIRKHSSYSPELLTLLYASRSNPAVFADRVAAAINFPLQAKQEILEAIDVEHRFELLITHLEQIAKMPPHAHPRSQPKTDRKVPSDDYHGPLAEDIKQIRERLHHTPGLPSEVVARALIEVDRLSQLPTASAEYGATKVYLDWLLSLPWGKCTAEDYDISEAEKILSAEYYGPTSLKEQILQRISVRKLQGGAGDSPTLCLIGAPGTGKASLAKAIAHALGKEFLRISVGGISDVTEIKGMSRTYFSALPGKIIRSLREVGSCDPVILIEDIDYFNLDNNATVNMALLEAIDSRRNSRFLDNYLGVPFDLSKVFFICSVRSFEEIPEQFIPRFEIIEIPGYIEKEKIVISKRYLIPKMLKKHGLTKSEVKFSDKALTKIITGYTQEAGLLAFSQTMEKICRKIALEKLKKPKKVWLINEKNLESYLGPALYDPVRAETLPEIGTAAGLAWTGAGGELMFIEGLKMKGNGDIITTGSLGEVMRESIQAAHSYVRSKADMLGIDFSDFNEFDVHIHFPSGAIPKDGPSAGIAVCLVIASVMSERPIRNDIAMTGEVTLRGRVLPVAGIKEKISAAYRAGIYHVALPKENQRNVKELPKEILRKVKFTYIERVDELFEICLLDFTPSSYTLEKIFAEEIAKVKRKKTTTGKKRKTIKANGVK